MPFKKVIPKNEISIVFGAMADPLGAQLKQQKLPVPKNIERWEKLSHALTLLSVYSILPAGAAASARKRLLKLLTKDVMKCIDEVKP